MPVFNATIKKLREAINIAISGGWHQFRKCKSLLEPSSFGGRGACLRTGSKDGTENMNVFFEFHEIVKELRKSKVMYVVIDSILRDLGDLHEFNREIRKFRFLGKIGKSKKPEQGIAANNPLPDRDLGGKEV